MRQAAQLFPDQATPELAAMSAYLTFAKGRLLFKLGRIFNRYYYCKSSILHFYPSIFTLSCLPRLHW